MLHENEEDLLQVELEKHTESKQELQEQFRCMICQKRIEKKFRVCYWTWGYDMKTKTVIDPKSYFIYLNVCGPCNLSENGKKIVVKYIKRLIERKNNNA